MPFTTEITEVTEEKRMKFWALSADSVGKSGLGPMPC